LTEEDQKKLIIAANVKVLNAENSEFGSSTQSFSQLTIKAVQPESETLTDKLTLNHETYICPTHRMSVEAQTNSSLKISLNQCLKKKSVQVNKGSDTGYKGL